MIMKHETGNPIATSLAWIIAALKVGQEDEMCDKTAIKKRYEKNTKKISFSLTTRLST